MLRGFLRVQEQSDYIDCARPVRRLRLVFQITDNSESRVSKIEANYKVRKF